MRRGIRRCATVATKGRGCGSVVEADGRLLTTLERLCAEAAARAGEWLKCAPGCGHCCHGPFPITELDAWRLRRGLDQVDPALAARLRERADSAVERLLPAFPGDSASGRLEQNETALDSFFQLHADLRCPALDPATGRCDLY